MCIIWAGLQLVNPELQPHNIAITRVKNLQWATQEMEMQLSCLDSAGTVIWVTYRLQQKCALKREKDVVSFRCQRIIFRLVVVHA